jgi:cell division protein FtsB
MSLKDLLFEKSADAKVEPSKDCTPVHMPPTTSVFPEVAEAGVTAITAEEAELYDMVVSQTSFPADSPLSKVLNAAEQLEDTIPSQATRIKVAAITLRIPLSTLLDELKLRQKRLDQCGETFQASKLAQAASLKNMQDRVDKLRRDMALIKDQEAKVNAEIVEQTSMIGSRERAFQSAVSRRQRDFETLETQLNGIK